MIFFFKTFEQDSLLYLYFFKITGTKFSTVNCNSYLAHTAHAPAYMQAAPKSRFLQFAARIEHALHISRAAW